MTQTVETARNEYTGNNSTTSFAFTFPITAAGDISVYEDEVLKTISTHYSVSVSSYPGTGNVVFGTAPGTGDAVLLVQNVPKTQSTSFTAFNTLPAVNIGNALDRASMHTVRRDDRFSTVFGVSDTMKSTDRPTMTISDVAADRTSKILGFNAAGTALVAVTEIGEFKGNWAASTAYVLRDIVKDTSNNNIYFCNTAHTSSGSQPISSNTDSAKWDLIVDAASATTSAATATAQAVIATAQAVIATAKAVLTASDATDTAADLVLTAADVVSAEAAKTSAETAAGAVAWQFAFDTSTSMADPGAGDFRMDSATVSAIRNIAFDATLSSTSTPDISAYIATWGASDSTIKGHLTIIQEDTPANFIVFSISSAVTDNTGWLQAVVNAAVASGGSLFGSTKKCRVTFTRTGDKGTTGSTGSTGSTGARGSDAGLDMTFESTTTDTDQGVGKVWFNNGTLSSASVAYMDDVDANSASINSLVDSWDDSTTTALRGTIKIVQQASPAIFAIYNITGAVTSASTYSKIPVSYITGAGSFTDADASSVSFFRTGNTGSAGSSTPADNVFRIQDNGDATKQIAFEASTISSGATRTVTMPDEDVTLGEGGVVSTVGKVFSNYNTISANVSTTTVSTENQFLMGTISVTGTAVWTIAGNGALTII